MNAIVPSALKDYKTDNLPQQVIFDNNEGLKRQQMVCLNFQTRHVTSNSFLKWRQEFIFVVAFFVS